MRTVFKHMSRQQATLGVVALAFVTVVLYSMWGASVLH